MLSLANPSTVTALSTAKSIGGAALAALLRNPQVVSGALGHLMSRGSGAASSSVRRGNSKRNGRRRRRRGGGSSTSNGLTKELNISAPLTQGIVKEQYRSRNQQLKVQVCRELGSFTKSERSVSTELSNFSLVAPPNTVTSLAALFNNVTSSLQPVLYIGPAEAGPTNLTSIAKNYCFYALRSLRIKSKTSSSPTSVAGTTQVSVGVVRNTSMNGTVGSPGSDIVSKQAHVDAMDKSLTLSLWENGNLTYTYNGDRVWSTDNTDSAVSLNPEQQFQLAMYAFGDANSGTSSSIQGSNIEIDYVCDFYEARPNIAQGSTLNEQKFCKQTGDPHRQLPRGRDSNGEKIIEGVKMAGWFRRGEKCPYWDAQQLAEREANKPIEPKLGKDEIDEKVCIPQTPIPSRESQFAVINNPRPQPYSFMPFSR